jgi:hypothetical protein
MIGWPLVGGEPEVAEVPRGPRERDERLVEQFRPRYRSLVRETVIVGQRNPPLFSV